MDRTTSITENVILFDGVCNFCNSSVNFIIERDVLHYYKFAALQSEYGNAILAKFHKSTEDFNSILVIENEVFYEKSDAVLKITTHLKGWKWVSYFKVLPKFFRDFFYDLIAKNRYIIFGKSEHCRLPSASERLLFLS